MTGAPVVKGFIETSFLDWPGKVAAVAFLPRCNYRCPYCHNHRLVTEPDLFEDWPLPLILGRLDRMRGWVDGVCVTGGEPTIHPELPVLCETLRREGWSVKLDTNGSNPDMVRELIREGLIQAAALDVKAPLEPIPYRRNGGPGADPEKVRASLEYLAASRVAVETRTTVHPALLSPEECRRLRRQVASVLGMRRRHTWQRCRVEEVLDEGLRARAPLTPESFERWKGELEAPALTEAAP